MGEGEWERGGGGGGGGVNSDAYMQHIGVCVDISGWVSVPNSGLSTWDVEAVIVVQ